MNIRAKMRHKGGLTMFKEGVTVKVASNELELSPYINTSKLFKVVSNKPYGQVGGWVEIANEDESIITQSRFLKEVY